ncbi:MAG: NAD(P)-dependent alcohol dehydrogenase, partial [Bacteroidetes bacterium]
TVTTADTMMRRAEPFISRFFLGLSKPKHPVTGTGFAGIIEATGAAVTQFKTGDTVFGETGISFGANAEYVCMPEDGVLMHQPVGMQHTEGAAFCDGPLTALNFLRNLGKIEAGQTVLINGAAGSIGTAAVQLAKYFGAHVTGVCSAANVELVKSLGADRVIDYTQTDFTQTGATYDIIFDTVGKSSFSRCANVLNPAGIYLSPVMNLPLFARMAWHSIAGRADGKKALFSATGLLDPSGLRTLLRELTGIYAAGRMQIVVDKRFPLEQAVTAHQYVDTGHKKGNVILLPVLAG